LGYGTPNLLEGTEYPLTRLTNNYQLLISLYRNNWIVRRVVDCIPEDMTRNWITIKTQVPPQQLDALDKLWRVRRIKERILEGLKWARLYGGAVGVMMIAGHEDILDQPLDFDDIMPGAFQNLLVVDRWVGAYPSEELVEDIQDTEFGLPQFYEITMVDGTVVRIHHSRVLRFVGRLLPYWEKLAEVYWGESEVEIIYEELKKRDNTSYNIASLVFLANLRVLKMGDLGQDLAVADPAVQKNLYETLQAQNWLMSNMGMYILDQNDGMEMHQYAFNGLNEIYESFMMDVAGACQIPVTRLFGRSPAGMDATGESDMQNYYETVQQAQESSLAPILNKLLPVMCMSEWGAIPDDLDYSFNPIQTPDSKDVADLVQQKTAAIVSLVNAGILSQKTALQELRQLSDTTGMFTNITDEQIEGADDSTSQGEVISPDAFASTRSMGATSQDRAGIPQSRQTGADKTPLFAP
jgi:phage-related protein (TIGR01555 family)